MEGLKVVIRKKKKKIKEKPNCVNNNLKCRNYSVLEGIVLLDTAINMLREDYHQVIS